MKKIYVENLVKNGILLVALLFCYPFIKASFDEKVGSLDPSLSGDLLVAVSIIAVTACLETSRSLTSESLLRIVRLGSLLI